MKYSLSSLWKTPPVRAFHGILHFKSWWSIQSVSCIYYMHHTRFTLFWNALLTAFLSYLKNGAILPACSAQQLDISCEQPFSCACMVYLDLSAPMYPYSRAEVALCSSLQVAFLWWGPAVRPSWERQELQIAVLSVSQAQRLHASRVLSSLWKKTSQNSNVLSFGVNTLF